MKANEAFNILKLEKKFPISKDQIKKNYHTQAKLNHPDITGNQEQMKLINEAYNWLIDNIDKINSVNIKKVEQEQLTELDEIADLFVNAYMSAPTRKKKKELLEGFLTMAYKYKKDIELDQKIKIFRDILNKK